MERYISSDPVIRIEMKDGTMEEFVDDTMFEDEVFCEYKGEA